jgi:hypothetical protein
MDKLKQVQKYQFWILLSVALILPLVGWFMATSGLSADVESRTKTIKDLHAKVNTTPADPNQEWKKGIEEINVEQLKQKNRAWRYMWEQQEPLMTWPAKMPSDPEKITPNQQEYWRTNYRKFLLELRQKVNPLDDDNPTGWVEYPEELLPNPDSEWVYQAPSIAQIVASQEDLWLLDSLLTSIALVNVGSNSFHDAPIRQIQKLYLRGGSPKGAGGGGTATKSSGSGGTSPGAGPGAAAMGDMAKQMLAAQAKSSEGGMGGLMGGQGGGGSKINSAEINADDDLGAERPAQVAKGATADKTTAKSSGGLTLVPPMISPISGQGGGTSSVGWSGSDKNRYRDDKDDLAWKTRGFHLEVIMDHRQVPELLTRLVDSTWRVTILRVQMSDIYGEDMPDVGSGTAGNRGGLTGGMPPGGPGRGGSAGMDMMMMKKSGQMIGSSGKSAPVRTAPRGNDEGGEGFGAQTAAAKEDPNLAHVAIVGLIYIAKKPPEEKTPATPPAPGGSSNTPPAANSPAPPAVAGPGKTNGTEADSAEATDPATGTAEEETMTEEPAEDAADKPSTPSEDTKPEADKSPADAGAAGTEGKK